MSVTRTQHLWILLALVGVAGCASGQLDSSSARQFAFSPPATDSAADGPVASEQILYQDPADDGLLSALSPARLRRQAMSAIGKGPDIEVAKGYYEDAERKFREAKSLEGRQASRAYLAAAKKYSAASERWPDSALEEDALLMVAESYFFANEYPEANKAYEILLKKYSRTRHLDAVESRRFKIAEYWLERGKQERALAINLTDGHRPWRDSRGAAIRILDRIRIDDPTGRLADDATMAAANAHFEDGRYLEADEFYTDLRDTFIDSEHQFMAHYLGVQAKVRAYQGPEYSGVALDEAEELVEKIRRQFPQETLQYQEQLQQMHAQVRTMLAERELTTAKFYDRRQQYGAARHYYEIVASKYRDTGFSDLAGERLAAIEGKPSEPAQPLAWLAKAFPDSEDKPLIVDEPGVYLR